VSVAANEEHYRRLERMYVGAPINQWFRPSIRVAEHAAEVTLTVRKDFHHAAHAAHGSVHFKMLDDAAFFAANSAVEDVFVLTVNFNIVLLRPMSDGVVTATGRLVHQSRSLLIADSELTDARGKTLARGNGTFMRSTIRLDDEVGYK
jgi:uncharacterized protein (TIGR00369 family)